MAMSVESIQTVVDVQTARKDSRTIAASLAAKLPWIPIVQILVVAAILLARRYFAACVIAAALISLDLCLLGSTNLWDYFVDPIVGVIAILWLLVHARLFERVEGPATSFTMI